jgi:hypothetical protein
LLHNTLIATPLDSAFSLSSRGRRNKRLTRERAISYWPGNAVLFLRLVSVRRRAVIGAVFTALGAVVVVRAREDRMIQ